jgi:acyl carrier protein
MLEKMKELVADQFSLNVSEIDESTSFKKDLNADSLDLFSLVMAMEEEYHIEIPSEDLGGLDSIGDVIAYLKEKGIEES